MQDDRSLRNEAERFDGVSERIPLFVKDPRRFMSIVADASAEARLRQLAFIDEMLVCECLRLSLDSRPEELQSTLEFYGLSVEGSPLELRQKVYQHLKVIIEQLGANWVMGFVPFVLREDEAGLVSTAVIDYTSMGSLAHEDQMTRVDHVLSGLNNGLVRNRGAVFGGLLALGDERVCRKLRHTCSQLNLSEIAVATKCQTGFTSAALIHFYLDWVESLIASHDYDSEASVGHILSGLRRALAGRVTNDIFDGPRPFPVPRDGPWPSIRRIPFKEFVTSISGRLYSLEAAEAPPKLMPHIISYCGLTPKSDPADIAEIHDPRSE